MKKPLAIIFASTLLLTGCNSTPDIIDVNYSKDGYVMKELNEEKVTVAFYYNFNKQEINLNSGLYATGDNLALKVETISKGTKVTKPDIDPIRTNYVFDGWHTDEVENSPFDFNNVAINSNTYLYAHWTQTQEEEFVEPEYVEPSKIDENITNLVQINSVLNVELNANSVALPTASINKLIAKKADVTTCLNYKMKTGVTLTATFNDSTNKVSYSAAKGTDIQNGEITITNNASNLIVGNTTYEGKAKKYEENCANFLDHKIMLAGSSSMENWSTSKEDLLPLATYNHGIGGTTAQQWRDCLNQRLVYPFSPKTVVYYVGVNNLINTSDSVQTTSSALIDMFNDVHTHLPDTQVYWVLINALPGYMSYLDKINQVNNAVKEYEKTHNFFKTVDAGQTLLKANGEPNSAFFLTDGLHMSKYGYVLWGGYLKNVLIEDMKKNA